MPPPVDNQSPNILDETQVTKFIYPTLFRSGLNYTGDSVCTIDLTGFIDGNSVIITPNCFHIFHTICIDAWLKNSHEKRCPNCNHSLQEYIIKY